MYRIETPTRGWAPNLTAVGGIAAYSLRDAEFLVRIRLAREL